jgi:CBS domain-containing protein
VQRIAVALDGSPLSWEALTVALEMARRSSHPLHIVTVVAGGMARPSPAQTNAAASSATWNRFLLDVQARATARAARADVPVELDTLVGPASEALVSYVREHEFDLLIVGATGHERPWSATTGGTAAKIAEEAPCAVLVVRPPTGGARAQDVMDRVAYTARPDTPLGDVLTALLDRGERLIPVVTDDGQLVGIVTLGTLLRRADPELNAHLAQLGGDREVHAHLQRVFQGRSTSQVMVQHPLTVQADAPIQAAGRWLVNHRITRAPVIDRAGHLVGILEEVGIMRGMLPDHGRAPAASAGQLDAGAPAGPEDAGAASGHAPAATLTAAAMAERDVPSLSIDAPADEVADALMRSRWRQALVVDGDGKLRGTVSEHDLVRRVMSPDAGGIVGSLFRWLPAQQAQALLGRRPRVTGPLTAEAMMSADVASVAPDTPAREVLRRLLQPDAPPALVVVDEAGRPLGLEPVRDLRCRGSTGEA